MIEILTSVHRDKVASLSPVSYPVPEPTVSHKLFDETSESVVSVVSIDSFTIFILSLIQSKNH